MIRSSLTSVLAATIAAALCLGAGSRVVEAEQHYRKALALLESGQTDAALSSLSIASELAPNNPLILNALGGALLKRGDTARAEGYFQQALKIDPSFTSARRNLALAYFSAAHYDEAMPHLRKLAEIPGDRPFAHLLLGMIATVQGRFREGANLLENSGDLVSQQPSALLSLARCYYELRRRDLVLPLLERLDGAEFLGVQDYLSAAILNTELGRYEQALKSLEVARRKHPESPAMDYQQAYTLAQLGQYSRALELLRRSTQKVRDGRSLNLLAWIAQKDGKLDLAIKALREAIESEPLVEDHYLDLSLLCAEHGGESLALEIIDIGLERIPRSYRLLVQKGAFLDEIGKREKAKRIFAEAIAAQEDHRLALAGLAATQTYGGEISDALTSLRRGIQKFPDDFYLHYLYGFTLQRSLAITDNTAGAVTQAKEMLEKAIRLNPGFADSYYVLGKLYIVSDPLKAVEHFEAALRLDSTHVSAKYQLALLYMNTAKKEDGERLMKEVRKEKAEKLAEDQRPRLGIARGSRGEAIVTSKDGELRRF